MTPEELRALVEERDFLRAEVGALSGQLKLLVKAEHALTRARREGDRQLERIRMLADFAFNIAGVEGEAEVIAHARGALLDQFQLEAVTVFEIDPSRHAVGVGGTRQPIDAERWTRLAEIHAPDVGTPGEPLADAVLGAMNALGLGSESAPTGLVWIPLWPCASAKLTLLVGRAGRNAAYHRDLPRRELLPFLRVFRDHVVRALDAAQLTSELRQQGAALAESNERLQTSLTDLERTQSQLVQAQKLEALGRLAGGIAHDFNNLLTVIVSHADLVRSSIRSDTEAFDDLNVVVDAARRATEITRRLLAFGRKQEHRQEVVDLNAATIDLSRMLGRLIGDEIVLHLDLDPSVGRIRTDPVHLEQILMNLVVNARDAMPSGGRLTIETRRARDSDRAAGLRDPTANMIALCVRDTGHGMDDSTRRQLFEPFFTTKPIGKGTGLGLATVYGLVQQNKGEISVTSRPGQGSAFTVLLPSAEGVGTGERRPVSEVPTRGTVMVVEDEDAIRRMVCRVLQKSGFEVSEARDGEEALKAAARLNRLDLVVTDIMMPTMGGPELASRLVALRPQLRVVFMSGHTFDRLNIAGLDRTFESFLSKPFTPDELKGAVEKAISPLLLGRGSPTV